MDPNYDEHEQRFSTPPQAPKQVTYVNVWGSFRKHLSRQNTRL